MDISANAVWGFLSLAFLILELLLGGSTLLLFIASISSFLVFASLYFNLIQDLSIVSQLIVFFASFCVLSVISWKKLKALFNKGQHNGYKNVVGQAAKICNEPLYHGKVGYIKWSGTTCRAKLSSDSVVEKLDVGTTVVITSVENNIFIVK